MTEEAALTLTTSHLKDSDSELNKRELLLILVAYHPSEDEVNILKDCLSCLNEKIGYSIVVNDYKMGESVDLLIEDSDYYLLNNDNPGYGGAVNRLISKLTQLLKYIGVLNIDLSWEDGTFEKLLMWLNNHNDVSLAVPQILDVKGSIQRLCKRNPTLLGLFSRRFLPTFLKPQWLKKYDHWYVMSDCNYEKTFEASYLSGCCMLIKSDAFISIGGFDERYFLYLEDADLTRSLSFEGRCIHLPEGRVVHRWGRGNYRESKLLIVNLISAWKYFMKWGFVLW